MCGIAGILHWGRLPDATDHINRMMSAIEHRGPDDARSQTFPELTLGFRRLAIVDIDGGAQPMSDRTGALWVVFNGEITNHRQLRKELESRGHRFFSNHSDTEVLLHGYREWGKSLVERLNGMFAFALWDASERQLFLARDRYGIKPLYVAPLGNQGIVFASEVKGILASKLVSSDPDLSAIYEYLNLQNCLDGRTPFSNIELFPPGNTELLSLDRHSRQQYWDYSFDRTAKSSFEFNVEKHRETMLDVVNRNIDTDVPVATYLSGGIDSAAITAAANRLNHEINSYSCIFDLSNVSDDAIVDEREYSREVAGFLDITHNEIMLSPDAIIGHLDKTMRALEYPRMGVSYENYFIAGQVAKRAKVVLSGMGGDEMHGGYVGRYSLLEKVIGNGDASSFPGAGYLSKFLPNWFRENRSGRERGEDLIVAMLNVPLNQHSVSEALSGEFKSLVDMPNFAERIRGSIRSAPGSNLRDKLCYLDAKHYLHGLLVLEDKLSMAHSLETRVPLLDNDLVDFVRSLPWEHLVIDDVGKRIFRHSVKPWVPDSIFLKPKMGFGPPEASWYRNQLAPWLRSRLSEKRVNARGVFDPGFVTRILNEHISGQSNHVALIWSLLSLDSWCNEFGFFGGRLD